MHEFQQFFFTHSISLAPPPPSLSIFFLGLEFIQKQIPLDIALLYWIISGQIKCKHSQLIGIINLQEINILSWYYFIYIVFEFNFTIHVLNQSE